MRLVFLHFSSQKSHCYRRQTTADHVDGDDKMERKEEISWKIFTDMRLERKDEQGENRKTGKEMAMKRRRKQKTEKKYPRRRCMIWGKLMKEKSHQSQLFSMTGGVERPYVGGEGTELFWEVMLVLDIEFNGVCRVWLPPLLLLLLLRASPAAATEL